MLQRTDNCRKKNGLYCVPNKTINFIEKTTKKRQQHTTQSTDQIKFIRINFKILRIKASADPMVGVSFQMAGDILKCSD